MRWALAPCTEGSRSISDKHSTRLCRCAGHPKPHGAEPRSIPAFDGKDLDIAKASLENFRSQVLRTVKVRGSEVSKVAPRIAVLTGGKIRRNNLMKLHVSKEAARWPVDQ
jgi:hypothetical protein